ncbi:diguanylate cyclase [Micromonospora sp. M12]
MAERLGAAVRDTPIAVEAYAGPVLVTVSVGIAVFPDNGSTGREVLEAADDALYAAKAAGRDTYRVAEVRSDVPTREIPVLACAVSPPDGLPRAGQHVQAPGAGRARPVGVGCGRTGIIAGRPGARPAGSARRHSGQRDGCGPGRPGHGAAGAGWRRVFWPHPPRQSRGR